MKKLLITSVFIIAAIVSFSQVPNGFNYQAVLRNSSGDLITDQSVDIEISIIDEHSGGTVLYTETHTKTTNSYGLVNLVIGSETPDNGLFEDINWAVNDKFIQVKVDATDMGTFQLLTVPFAMHAESATNLGSENVYTGTDTLFVVKDAEGNPVFVVFPDGVKVIVEEVSKGRIGGFAVSGRSPTKDEETDIFIVTPDSTRIFVNDTIQSKGRIGGFAVSGRSPTKGITSEYLVVTQDSTRVYISDTTLSKGRIGGFAVSGRSPTKVETKDYFNISGSQNVDTVGSEPRIYWYPKKEAFLTGRVLVESPDSVGMNSMATGFESKAKGKYSQALGYKAVARGDYSTAIGDSAIASGLSSFSFGDKSFAVGEGSFAFGYSNRAKGKYSFASGNSSITNGESSVAIGYLNNSSGFGSSTFGYENSAAGDYAFAAGKLSSAVGSNSIALGYSNYSEADGSSSFGYDNNTTGDYSIAVGYSNISSGIGSSSFGYDNSATGLSSLAAGRQSIASGNYSVAMGYANNSSKIGSSSFGYDNDATGDYSIAAGYSNNSSGLGSSSFGYDNTVAGNYSVAIGRQSNASGAYSLAIGYLSKSEVDYTYTIGQNNQAKQMYSFAFGKDCIANENFAFAFGVTASSTGEGAYAFGAGAHAAGNKSYAFGEQAYTEKEGSYALGSNAKSYGIQAHAIGTHAIANANYSTAIGYQVNTASSGWDYATVLGKYNTSATSPLLVVGNGTSTVPSNALVLQTNGDLGLGISNPAQKLDINGNIRLSGGDRQLEIISGYLDIRPHDGAYGIILRDYTGSTTIWSSIRTVPALTDYLHISMNSTSTSEGLVISDNGNVGIGIVTPGEKLDIAGDIRLTAGGDVVFGDNNTRIYEISDDLYFTADDDIYFRSDDDIYIATGDNTTNWVRFDNGNRRLGIGTETPGYNLHVMDYRSGDYIAQFRNTSTINPHGIAIVVGDYNDGVAYIGCKTPTEHLGGLYANSSGDIYLSGTSDRRAKNSITDTEINGLEIIQELKVRDYFYNDRPSEVKTTGFIAQEVLEVLPGMVIYDNEKDLYMVARDYLVPHITKAIQEQQSQIEELKSENKELKEKLNEIINLLEKD